MNMKKLIILILLYVGYVGLGNTQTATIGTQVWSTKNLNVSTFRNGDPILEAKTPKEWEQAGEKGEPAWCYYDNNASNDSVYGKLYNWYALNDPRGLAPEGWHVPSAKEWEILADSLGGAGKAGAKMKRTTGWNSFYRGGDSTACSNCVSWADRKQNSCKVCKGTLFVIKPKVQISGNGTNESGFSASASGLRFSNGAFGQIGTVECWWISSDPGTSRPTCRALKNRFDGLGNGQVNKGDGYSVRCLKD